MDSIDIFDTAIFRDVYEPTDIFQLLEDIFGNNFKQKRIEAENKAHKQYKFPNIQEIYKFLPQFNYQKEIDMEMQHIYANPTILEMYKKNPKNYVFISDMYLPSSVLRKMLEKCGYENPIVYVSCEEKCNKGSGLLFEKVQKRIGKIEKHYGDNYKSDVEGCIKKDIKPVFYPALHKRQLTLPMTKNPLLKKWSAALTISEESDLTKLAKWYAPLIYEFTKWIISKRKKGQKIFFLSRDMFMPYLIAKTILKQEDVYYIYCSRKSLASLFINSNEKCLQDKIKIILNSDEYNFIKNKGTKEALTYIKNLGIRNNDIIVDIGYSGSTQKILEKFLNIKLKGLYVQLDKVPTYKNTMDMEMYLNRFVLLYRFLAEFIFTSPEDCIYDYVDGKVIFEPDHEKRKQYAKHINTVIINPTLFRRINRMKLSVFDVEQILIHIQNNLTDGMMELFNEPILTNRQKTERGINFDKKAILNGKLLECYNKSYAKPLFKKMLLKDPELSSLITLLPT